MVCVCMLGCKQLTSLRLCLGCRLKWTEGTMYQMEVQISHTLPTSIPIALPLILTFSQHLALCSKLLWTILFFTYYGEGLWYGHVLWKEDSNWVKKCIKVKKNCSLYTLYKYSTDFLIVLKAVNSVHAMFGAVQQTASRLIWCYMMLQ